MRLLKTFIISFYNSITSVDYYYDVTQASLSFCLKFFIGFSLLYSALTSIVIYQKYIQPVRPIIASLPNQFVETIYPEDLTILVQDGRVQINQPQPYFIPADRLRTLMVQLKDQILGANSTSFDYLLVIDTTANLENYNDYNTFALLTADTFYYLDPRYGDNPANQVQVNALPLTGVTAIFNHDTFQVIAAELVPYFQAAVPFTLIPIFFLLVFILPYFHFVYILGITLLGLFISKLIDFTLSFTKIFQIAIHLFAAVSLVLILPQLVNLNLEIPLLRFTLIVIALIIILVHTKELSLHRRRQLKVS